MDKSAIRKAALERRRAMPQQQAAKANEMIFHRLIHLEPLALAERVMSYISYNGEVDTRRAIQHWMAEGKRVSCPAPVANTNEMKAIEVSDFDQQTRPGAYGILEPLPDPARETDPADLDVVIVPGVLFDYRGYRIGHGKGYYDRFLGRLRPTAVTIGLAFSWQVLRQVDTAPWDLPVRWIVTERDALYAATPYDTRY